ncbi:hypothetical protein ABIF93_003509 [Bradyrhizobium japonicum]
MGDDVGMPVHHQRPIGAEAEGENEVGEREGGMEREQIVLCDLAPEPPGISRSGGKRQEIAEGADALDRHVVDDDLAPLGRLRADQHGGGEAVLQARADVADHRQRAAEQVRIIDLEDVQHRRAVRSFAGVMHDGVSLREGPRRTVRPAPR